MKGIIICQSVVRRQCCLGLTDSRPPFFGNILHYHLVFFSNLSLCSTKDDPKAEKASLLSFLLAFSIAQRSPSSSSASIFFYILTSQTVNTTWVLEFFNLWSLLYVEYVDLTKWEGEKVKCLYRFQYTDVTNNTNSQQSTTLFSLEFYINLTPFLRV